MTIRLDEIGNTYGEIIAFGDKLLFGLGDALFLYRDIDTIVFSCLKQIFSISDTVENYTQSLEDHCKIVIKHFGIDTIDMGQKSSFTVFCESILRLDKIPSKIYDELMDMVKGDLLSISELIKFYEDIPFIKTYLINNEKPTSHDDWTVFDFYKRCVNERIEILNYQLYRLKERALRKSRYKHYSLLGITDFFSFYHDRPYRSSIPSEKDYFDYRNIELARYKVSHFPIREISNVKELYIKDKSLFFEEYFKRKPIEEHLDSFNFYVKVLPFLDNRAPIFEELIILFKSERWIGFYSLALMQIEGVFSEMCDSVSPNKNFSNSSLPLKVKYVRAASPKDEYYFDYYQYYMPKLRNKFAHTGFDSDFRIKSYELLVDLSELLELFYELETPLVKIKKLYERRDFNDFIKLEDFLNYFNLVKQVNKQKLVKAGIDIEDFERNFLTKDCSIDYTIFETLETFPTTLNNLMTKISIFLFDFHDPFYLNNTALKELRKLLTDNKKIDRLNLLKNDEEFNKFVIINEFVSSYKESLPSLDDKIVKYIEDFNNKNSFRMKLLFIVYKAIYKNGAATTQKVL